MVTQATADEVNPVPARDIEEAAARIRAWVRKTPALDLETGAFGVPGLLTLKLELLQHTGSFKARGAFNLLLSRNVPASGVVAASGGNFGLAVAYAARKLGHRATIFVPESSPEAKRARLATLGAEVVVTGALYHEALAASGDYAEKSGALFAHAYDQPEVVAGAGTCALELDEQSPDLDTVLVAVGGGGLIGGVASWYRGRARVVSVESERAPTLAAALDAGKPVDVEVAGIVTDTLGARRAGDIGFASAKRWVERAVLVPDAAIIEAQRLLWEGARVLCELGSAATLAALLSGAYVPGADERVGLLICGANLDPAKFGTITTSP